MTSWTLAVHRLGYALHQQLWFSFSLQPSILWYCIPKYPHSPALYSYRVRTMIESELMQCTVTEYRRMWKVWKRRKYGKDISQTMNSKGSTTSKAWIAEYQCMQCMQSIRCHSDTVPCHSDTAHSHSFNSPIYALARYYSGRKHRFRSSCPWPVRPSLLIQWQLLMPRHTFLRAVNAEHDRQDMIWQDMIGEVRRRADAG